MNWKDRLTALKVGDIVEVIKRSPSCTGCSFEECKKRLKGSRVVYTNSNGSYGDIMLERNIGGRCAIPKECLRKINV